MGERRSNYRIGNGFDLLGFLQLASAGLDGWNGCQSLAYAGGNEFLTTSPFEHLHNELNELVDVLAAAVSVARKVRSE